MNNNKFVTTDEQWNLIRDLDKRFSDYFWSTEFNYSISKYDLRDIYKIINQYVFGNQLFTKIRFGSQFGEFGDFDEIVLNIERPTNQPYKAVFGWGQCHGQWGTMLSVVANRKDNLSQLINSIIHEMIHAYDYMHGKLLTLTKMGIQVRTDPFTGEQYMGSYNVHGPELFLPMAERINEFGFNVKTKFIAGIDDRIFYRKPEGYQRVFAEKEHETYPIANPVQTLFDHLKTNDYKNLDYQDDENWLITIA